MDAVYTGTPPRSHRLVAQDTTLSRWRHGFKSRWDYAGQRPSSVVRVLARSHFGSQSLFREFARFPLAQNCLQCGLAAGVDVDAALADNGVAHQAAVRHDHGYP